MVAALHSVQGWEAATVVVLILANLWILPESGRKSTGSRMKLVCCTCVGWKCTSVSWVFLPHSLRPFSRTRFVTGWLRLVTSQAGHWSDKAPVSQGTSYIGHYTPQKGSVQTYWCRHHTRCTKGSLHSRFIWQMTGRLLHVSWSCRPLTERFFVRIWQHLLTLARRGHITIIITTHYVEEARQAHMVM